MALFGDRKLKLLEDTIEREQSPLNYVNLIKYLQTKGNFDRAYGFAEQAVKDFPHSDELFGLYYPLLKGQLQPQIKQLREAIDTNPSVNAYVQLAEIYKDLREEEEALRLCRQAIEKFTNDDSPYLIIGELRLLRFYKDLLARDGQLARENLEKAFEINPKNYRALLTLSKFYLQIGAVTKANQRLKDLLFFAPEDETIRKLLDTALELEKPSHEDMDILLQNVEVSRALFHTLPGTRTAEQKVVLSPEIFQKPLESLDEVPSIFCLLVCDDEGNLIAHYAEDDVDFNTLYEVASGIYQTVQNSSKKMDLGKFQTNQIDGPFGSIHIVASYPVVYIVFGAPGVYKEIQKFISKVPVNSTGVSYA